MSEMIESGLQKTYSDPLFGVRVPFDIAPEQLSEEELQLMLADLRSIKANTTLRGTKE